MPFLPPLAATSLGFATSILDRKAEWRSDAGYLADERALADCETVLLAKDNAVADVVKGRLKLRFLKPELVDKATDDTDLIYLGRNANRPVFAARSGFQDENDVTKLIDLRSLAMSDAVEPGDLALMATARSLYAWHDRYGFCSNCGAKTEMVDAGWRRYCQACSSSHFPRTDPVVIMLISSGDKCLLGRSPHFRPGMYSCLAGFVEPGETLEDAVRRETIEEAGIKTGAVSYLMSQPWPFPSSLMIGCKGEALSEEIIRNDNELEDARWFSRDELIDIYQGKDEQFWLPPQMAIAHHLIHDFLTDG